MHPDLSPHLHTPECNKLIEALKSCHNENSFMRFTGKCNHIDSQVWKCLKKERLERSANNRRKALERQEIVRKKITEEN